MLKRRSGLGSLIPGADLPAEHAPDLAPIALIAVNPYQPRRVFEPGALDELTSSILQYGILQPLVVRLRDGGGYELIAGERRLTAARKAGLTDVPIVVRECDDQQMLALALVENIQREDLNAMEAAQSYRQLIDQFGLSQSEVADHVGKSRSAVANTLRLLALPAPIQQAVSDGAVSEGHARTLLAIDDADKQRALFKQTVEEGLSVRALEALVNPAPRATTRRKSKTSPADANLNQVQLDLQNALGTRVRLKPGSTARKGTLEIEYYTTDDLNRIYELLMR